MHARVRVGPNPVPSLTAPPAHPTPLRLQGFDPVPGSEERVVALTSIDDALSPYCAAQDALIRCVIALTAGGPPVGGGLGGHEGWMLYSMAFAVHSVHGSAA